MQSHGCNRASVSVSESVSVSVSESESESESERARAKRAASEASYRAVARSEYVSCL